jgi:hypothetical protein
MMTKKPAPLSTFAGNTPAVATPVALSAVSGDKMRQKVFRLTPAQDRLLKEFCAHQDLTIQDVVLDGIKQVFKKRGLTWL